MSGRVENVRALLSGHRAADPEEAGYLARMRELCAVAVDPFSRDTYVPGHFTASAFILSPERDALLLIHHAKLHRWLQPGGHVEPEDSSLLAAARREAREEVGLEELSLELAGPFDLDIHEIPARLTEPAHAHFDVRFLFRARALEVRAASDAKAARWVPLSEVSLEISDRSVMRAIEKLLGAP